MTVLDEFVLDDQTAVVTGGGRGLGQAMATALAEAGANVAILDIKAENAEDSADAIADLGVETMAIGVDITKKSAVLSAVETIEQGLGPIDVWLNNAGVVLNAPAEETSLEDWQQVIDVNLTGTFLCSKYVGRRMIKHGSGSIINISSMSGFIANYPQPQVAYNASKAGVIMVTRSLASEWASDGVRVNAIAPGYMRTNLVNDVLEDNPNMEKTWLEYTPMDRLGRPDELGGVAVFLASEASSYMTGEIISYDGGYTIR